MVSAAKELRTLQQGEGCDPHGFLGIHEIKGGKKVIRLWRPGAERAYVEVFGQVVEAPLVHPSGLFEFVVPAETTSLDYRVYHQSGLLAHDPYAMVPTFGEMDAHLFALGVPYKIYDV